VLVAKDDTGVTHIRLMDLKGNIDCSGRSKKFNRTDCTQERRSFQVNSILSFCHTDKQEEQYVGQMISIKGHII
jgi:hypothetical protein